MNRYERSMEIHKKGYNCCQCVLNACMSYTGLDEKTGLYFKRFCITHILNMTKKTFIHPMIKQIMKRKMLF